MNSEELELSLRAEFESYVKGVSDKFREELESHRAKIESEFDEHRTRIYESLAGLSERFTSEHQFDAAFTESVTEHLRLARDEGAKITAAAMAEAEALEKEAAPEADYTSLRDAIADISSKDSQSSILKALVSHGANYTARGAFFIVKSEHFVGWKVFGNDAGDAESTIRDIHFPVSADSILGQAANSLSTVEGSYGSHEADKEFLEPLNFGTPDRMYAIPLIARGRTVAVLYADYGHEGFKLNTDALEALVHVAGMTVELLAASRPRVAEAAPAPLATSYDDNDARVFENTTEYSAAEIASHIPAAEPVSTPFSEPAAEYSPETAAGDSFETVSTPSVFTEPLPSFDSQPVAFESNAADERNGEFEPSIPVEEQVAVEKAASSFETEFQAPSYGSFESAPAEPSVEAEFGSADDNVAVAEAEPEVAPDFAEPVAESAEPAMVFSDPVEEVNPYEEAPFQEQTFETPVAEPAVETTPMAEESVPRARLSDRNVDLPIEVEENERRLHNDARRFARLLVSEIKLYNEQKVREGRESADLYDRLKEAIDRSREMYDKRVQPPVAAKFDYFHYEVVNALAEGEESRLGHSYPGART
ncbi:MAG TPA: hypothetical protein PKA82_02460 [Pyrinomonadaceae bacterium]|nr:hypothetical protein [Pyrinomonadaceae bacterium]